MQNMLAPSPAVITVNHEPLEEVEDFTYRYLKRDISKNNATSKDKQQQQPDDQN